MSSFVDDFIRLYLNGTSSDIDQVVDIDAVIGQSEFVSKDGFLMSIIKVNGRSSEDGSYSGFTNSLKPLINKISGGLKEGIHSIQITYIKDAGKEEQLIESSISNSRDKATSYGFIGFDTVFDDQKKYIAQQIVDESVFLAVWTNTSFLRPRQIAVEKEEIEEARKLIPLSENAQGLIDTYSQMKIKHTNYVNSVVSGLAASGVSSTILNRDKAMLSMSSVINPYIPDDFQFIFPDRQTFPKTKEYAGGNNSDCSHLIWDSLSSQIFKDDDIDIDLTENVVRVGDRYHTTFEVKNPPRDLVLFNSLGDIIRRDVPVMISYSLSSASSFTFFWKQLLSALPYPSSNKRIKKSINAVKLLTELGDPDIEYKVSVSTWSKQPTELLDNKEYLKATVSGWGNSVVRNYKGCPFNALASSIHGINSRTFGTSVYAPLTAAVAQLPLGRRLRFWKSSALNLVGGGDVLYPYSPQSSSQKYWNIGICATMGSGKSVFLQNLTFAHIFGDSVPAEMPYVGYLDVGFSAKVFIDSMQTYLPKNKQYLFKHITYENNKKYVYNIFGTQLGCRSADDDLTNQIVSTLVGIVTPAGATKINDDFSALIRKLVGEVYLSLSDREKPKEYREGRSPSLHAALAKINYDPTGKTYWQITDDLFDRKKYVLAEYAQRYAVPTIQDLILQLTISDTAKNVYGKIKLNNNESLTDYVRRILTESTEKYPVFSGVTTLDVGLARVIVLDLDRVTKTGSPELDKDSSVFYSLARFVVSRNMFLSKGLMEVVPERYKKYHQKRIDVIRYIPKLMVYDEFHRLKSVPVLNQIKQEMREGRKWFLINVMASQLLGDFDKDTQLLLSSLFLMSNDAGSYDQIKEAFDLDENTMSYVKNELTGPQGSYGTPMLAKFKFKKGTLTQRLRFVLYPQMYWLTTSDSIDNSLKSRMMSQMIVSDAIDAISKKYKFGCRDVFENIANSHPDKNVRADPISYMASTILNT